MQKSLQDPPATSKVLLSLLSYSVYWVDSHFYCKDSISVPCSTCYVCPVLHEALHQQTSTMQSLSMALCSDGEASSSAEV